jgi:hypothetical protein
LVGHGIQQGHEVPAYGKGKLGVGRAAKVFFDLTNDGQSVCPPLVARDINPRQNNSNVPRDASSTTSTLDKTSFYLLFPLLVGILLAL